MTAKGASEQLTTAFNTLQNYLTALETENKSLKIKKSEISEAAKNNDVHVLSVGELDDRITSLSDQIEVQNTGIQSAKNQIAQLQAKIKNAKSIIQSLTKQKVQFEKQRNIGPKETNKLLKQTKKDTISNLKGQKNEIETNIKKLRKKFNQSFKEFNKQWQQEDPSAYKSNKKLIKGLNTENLEVAKNALNQIKEMLVSPEPSGNVLSVIKSVRDVNQYLADLIQKNDGMITFNKQEKSETLLLEITDVCNTFSFNNKPNKSGFYKQVFDPYLQANSAGQNLLANSQEIKSETAGHMPPIDTLKGLIRKALLIATTNIPIFRKCQNSIKNYKPCSPNKTEKYNAQKYILDYVSQLSKANETIFNILNQKVT